MTAKVVRNWLTQVGAKTLFIEPGGPWENGYASASPAVAPIRHSADKP
jgi:hypothetical protein